MGQKQCARARTLHAPRAHPPATCARPRPPRACTQLCSRSRRSARLRGPAGLHGRTSTCPALSKHQGAGRMKRKKTNEMKQTLPHPAATNSRSLPERSLAIPAWPGKTRKMERSTAGRQRGVGEQRGGVRESALLALPHPPCPRGPPSPLRWADQPPQPQRPGVCFEARDAAGSLASQQGRSHTRRGPQWPNTLLFLPPLDGKVRPRCHSSVRVPPT